MSEVKNIPGLRFPEFDKNWDKTVLQNVCEVNPRSTELPNSFVYIDLESVNSGKLLFQNKILKDGSPSRAQRLLESGDIIYQTVRPYQKNNYLFDLEGDYVASTGYAQLRSKQNNSFLYQLLHTEKFVNRVLLRSTGSNYPAINSSDLKKITFDIPSLPEQQKIADFLTAVDKRIELLEKKKTRLETYKKGVMKKIFNQEIRFKDDSGNDFPDWEEKRLGEVCKIQKGKQLNKSELIDTGEYPAINGGINPSGYTDEWNTVADTITISEGGNSCGYVNYIKTNFWCGGHCYSLLEIQNYLQKVYLFEYLKFRESSIMNLRVGSGLPNIQKREIDSFHILIPSINEQKTISSFLSTIGNQIELLETQIEKSKTWKKGLLQKMFV
ncbi:type I restriction enzyme, S subunit [Tenacibaculum sp. MAR_2010_89]|nr:type I restriction enzyme, S subunit [Tenacibaculum sp. MAR_2010_89]